MFTYVDLALHKNVCSQQVRWCGVELLVLWGWWYYTVHATKVSHSQLNSIFAFLRTLG